MASQPAGEPTVTISEHCRGLVEINNLSVCSDGNTFEHAHIACMEQDCGKAVLVNDVGVGFGLDGLLIRCESYHDQLGKCSRVQGKCKKGLMYIQCAGKKVCVCPSKQKQQIILENVSKMFSIFSSLFKCRKHQVENQRRVQRSGFGQ